MGAIGSNAPVVIQWNKETVKECQTAPMFKYGGKNSGSKWYQIGIDWTTLIAGKGRTKRGTWLGIGRDFR